MVDSDVTTSTDWTAVRDRAVEQIRQAAGVFAVGVAMLGFLHGASWLYLHAEQDGTVLVSQPVAAWAMTGLAAEIDAAADRWGNQPELQEPATAQALTVLSSRSETAGMVDWPGWTLTQWVGLAILLALVIWFPSRGTVLAAGVIVAGPAWQAVWNAQQAARTFVQTVGQGGVAVTVSATTELHMAAATTILVIVATLGGFMSAHRLAGARSQLAAQGVHDTHSLLLWVDQVGRSAAGAVLGRFRLLRGDKPGSRSGPVEKDPQKD